MLKSSHTFGHQFTLRLQPAHDEVLSPELSPSRFYALSAR